MQPVTKVLVVANRTSSTPRLLEEVRRRAKEKPCAFTLLIPDAGSARPGAASRAAADWTLAAALPLLSRAAHGEVDSRIGGPDPYTAVKQAVEDGGYDEVIISTLPRKRSRGSAGTCPRVERLGLPVRRSCRGEGAALREEPVASSRVCVAARRAARWPSRVRPAGGASSPPAAAVGRPPARRARGRVGAAPGTTRTPGGTGARGPHREERPQQRAGRQRGDQPLQAQREPEGGRVAPRVRAVGGERLLARRLPGEHAPQLAAARDPEVERGADPLAGEGEAVARAVAGEEDAVLGRRPQRVREPVALVAHRVDAEPRRDSFVGSLTWSRGS